MIIKQISVFLENRPGSLKEVLSILNESNINVRAMSVAETMDFGILRFIVKNPDEVVEVLRQAQFTVKITPVLMVLLGDHPGAMLEEIQRLSDDGINIEYFYAFVVAASEQARIVLKVDDVEEAESLISSYKKNNNKSDTNGGADLYW